jgi:hypothetical protein
VPDGGQPSILPLRPLTTGELLDAAVSLLRAYGRVLLPVGAGLAVGEQILLAPLRDLASVEPPYWGPDFKSLGAYWLLFATGCATEVWIIAVLGGLSSRAAVATVLGQHSSARDLLRPRGGRFGRVLLIACVVAVITFLLALIPPFFLLAYASVGLAVPALIIDRLGAGRALSRGAALAWRAGARAAGIRLLGYVSWIAIRLALGLFGVAALEISGLGGGPWVAPVGVLVWVLVNVVAYSTLACLDAVLHLETRMRTEGLDIWLSRAARHAPLAPHLLAVSR